MTAILSKNWVISWGWRLKPRAALCVWLLATVSTAVADQAAARDSVIVISGGPLAPAIAALSRQTGIAIGIEGELPTVSVNPVRGTMSPASALKRMLRGTGLVAVRVGKSSYRLERQDRLSPVLQPAAVVASVPQDIVVTAGKRNEMLVDIPLSVSVVSLPEGAAMEGTAGTAAIAGRIEGLALTNIGPGHNRQFIRGVADSPFSGPSQSTVSLQIDDVRATYNAPDPDLRLVDIERVEVLKGPQGPLYGTGALGGVYHIITRKPDLERFSAFVSADGAVINDGDYGVGGQAMFNIPVVANRLGFRAVAYASREPGWIDTAAGGDRNYMKLSGGRAALRAIPADGWTLDVAGTIQWLHVDDSQYVFARHSRFRDTTVSEPQDNDFRMSSATLRGSVGGVQILAAVGLVGHEVKTGLDATASAAALGVSGPAFVEEERKYHMFDSELRLSGGGVSSLQWLGGVSYLNADNRQDSDLAANGANASLPLLKWRQQVSESAIFGEVSIPILTRFRAVAGARLFHWSIENETGLNLGSVSNSRSKTGVTPSLALQWKPGSHSMIFARYASAFRPGGLSPTTASDGSYDSDELANFELGTRLSFLGG
ncbi:MAG: TonB-dependent receptor, partial [Sphingobium sp.]